MNRLKSILLLGLAALAFGCPARSLFPLFAEKDLRSLPALVGTWINPNGDTVTIQPSADKTYQAAVHNKKGETAQYTGQVGKLGYAWFLDSYPMEKGIDHHVIPAHIISKIRIEGDSLWVSSLESDWLRRMIDAGKMNVPHVKRGDDVILTASAEELQELVLRYADDKEAFPVEDKPAVRLRL